MRKEIKNIITKDGEKICRITTPDERWYGKEIINEETWLPEIKWLPSVTWIKSYYYMSPYLMKWIADKGLTEADRLKKEAGLKGDKVHQATEIIDNLGEIRIDDKLLNKESGEMEELTAVELEAIKSYSDFVDEMKPELIANEMTVFSDRYAGTLDRIFKIDGQIWIIDLKTSQAVYKDMWIQVSAYSHADIDYQKLGITEKEWNDRKLAILQIGYSKNKKRYKFTEIPDRMDLFEITYQTWAEENPNTKPRQRDFPLKIVSEFRKEEFKGKVVKTLKTNKTKKSL